MSISKCFLHLNDAHIYTVFPTSCSHVLGRKWGRSHDGPHGGRDTEPPGATNKNEVLLRMRSLSARLRPPVSFRISLGGAAARHARLPVDRQVRDGRWPAPVSAGAMSDLRLRVLAIWQHPGRAAGVPRFPAARLPQTAAQVAAPTCGESRSMSSPGGPVQPHRHTLPSPTRLRPGLPVSMSERGRAVCRKTRRATALRHAALRLPYLGCCSICQCPWLPGIAGQSQGLPVTGPASVMFMPAHMPAAWTMSCRATAQAPPGGAGGASLLGGPGTESPRAP